MSVEALALDLIDEADMEEAKERLKHAQEHGIDHEVWHIYGSNTSNFPNYDRGFLDWISFQKREFKSSSESGQDYISRLVRSGQNIDFNGNLYVVKGSLGLDFKLRTEGTQETREKIRFYDLDKDSTLGGIIVDLEDVEGIVPVRNHNFRLDYQGWNMAKNLQLSSGHMRNEPDKIVYHS
jgi:hypothetical protein